MADTDRFEVYVVNSATAKLFYVDLFGAGVFERRLIDEAIFADGERRVIYASGTELEMRLLASCLNFLYWRVNERYRHGRTI